MTKKRTILNKSSQFIISLLFICFLFSIVTMTLGCQKRELRGRVVKSADNKTYLVVDDDKGGKCGPILIDGEKWPYQLHVSGLIEPGIHIISCGGEIEFEIEKGTTFYFDYWGP